MNSKTFLFKAVSIFTTFIFLYNSIGYATSVRHSTLRQPATAISTEISKYKNPIQNIKNSLQGERKIKLEEELGVGIKQPLILILGRPGSGKGTIAKAMSQRLGVPYISMGQILREMWRRDPTIPNTPGLASRVLRDYIIANRIDVSKGIIFDHNPRYYGEFEEFVREFTEEHHLFLGSVINVRIDEEEARRRIEARGRSEDFARLKEKYYNPDEGILTVFDQRMRQHREVAERLIEKYRQEGLVFDVDNQSNSVENNTDLILGHLKDRFLVTVLMKLTHDFPDKKIVLGISGPTGVGKSSTAIELREALLAQDPGLKIGILRQDRFFYTDEELERFNIERRNAPNSVRVDWILKRIKAFREGKSVNQPKLERRNGRRIRLRAREAVKADDILIVEGVYIFNNDMPEYQALLKEFDIKLFVDSDLSDIKSWWVGREVGKGRGSEEELSRKWEDELRPFIEQQKGLWRNSDLIVKKDRHHLTKDIYLVSRLGRGTGLKKVKDVYLNPLHAVVQEAIEGLQQRMEQLEVVPADREKIQKIISQLSQLERDGKIGSFDIIAKGDDDYLLGFADSTEDRIGLIHEFFRRGNPLNGYLRNTLFYLGYISAFNIPYQAVDADYLILEQKMFDRANILPKENITQTLSDSLKPQPVYHSPLSAAELGNLNRQEGRDSLALAELLAADIRKFHGGRLPKVMFITPTKKGGGVTVLVKDIAEVLFSPGVGLSGGWVSMVRHQHPDFWGISGKFQRGLDGSVEELTDDDIRVLETAMRWNVERLDLRDVDFIFLHDPYTLGMIPFIREKYPNIKIVWINHGDISKATGRPRELMEEYLSRADSAVFSWVKDYIPKRGVGIPAVHMVHGINPKNTKNVDLSARFIEAVADRYGIDINRPVILQVGRYNPSKDPLQSIASFLKLKKAIGGEDAAARPQLVISGVAISPGDWKLYNNLRKFVEYIGDRDIHIITADNQVTELTEEEENSLRAMGFDLPNIEPWELSDLEMNGLQRIAAMGIHPALHEGFGLVISEALIKDTPVVASAVGGIPMQIKDSRLLVDLPEGHESEIDNRYDMLRHGDFPALLSCLQDYPLTQVFADKMQAILEADNSDLNSMNSRAKGHIHSNYSILRSLVGHLALMDLQVRGDRNEFLERGKIIEDIDTILCRILINRLADDGLSREHFNIIKNKIIDYGDMAIGLLIREIKMSSAGKSYHYVLRLEKILSGFGRRVVPRIIMELDTEDEYIREQFCWTLVFMGEVAASDLIKALAMPVSSRLTQGIIRALVRIGYMGNKDLSQALKDYLLIKCGSSYRGLKTYFGRLGFTDYETLGDMCMLISSFSDIRKGEIIAAQLLQKGFYPLRHLVTYLSGRIDDTPDPKRVIEESLAYFERCIEDIQEKGLFNKEDDLDVALGYTILIREAKRRRIRFRMSYEEYERFVKQGKETANLELGGAKNLAEKQDAELNYLSWEARQLQDFILGLRNKADRLGRPLWVVANKTYGEIAISPVEEEIRDEGITILKKRIASDKTHLYPYYVQQDLFTDTELRFISEQEPIIVVVDGTNSLRGTVLESTGRRGRVAHYPDAYMGYRNYFIALNEALGISVSPEDFHIPAETLKTLKGTPQFQRLKRKITSEITAAKREGYAMHFWSNSKVRLPIREERYILESPESISIEEIHSPTLVFAQTCTEDTNMPDDRKALTYNITHTSGYYDIALEELGYEDFFCGVTVDEFGPHLRADRRHSESIARKYTRLSGRYEELSEIEPLSVEDNVHEEYRDIEESIVALQQKYVDLINTGYDDLLRALRSNSEEEVVSLLERLIDIRKGLSFVLKVRKRFIESGWPCRHCHTNFDGDDGNLSPEELVDHAIANGITTLYVTGHDTLEGSIKAMEYVKTINSIIETLPGVEIETPFEVEDGSLFGFMHWRVIGPKDADKIEQMRRLTQEIDRRLEIFLGAKFKRVLSLADRDNFDELVTEEVIDRLRGHYDIGRGTFISPDDTYDMIKDRLYTALCELRDYTERTPREEYMPKFLNKLNIVGSWTKRIWDDKGNARRALRALGDIIFDDDNILTWLRENKRELPISTQEALREFSEIGCYSIAAHPWLEISKGDIEKGRFIELAVEMAQEGVLQGAGRGWKDDRAEVDAMIDRIATLSDTDFRKDGSSPDFHGPARTDIRRGERLPSGEYAQDGEEPDREGYFIEINFFTDKYLSIIRDLMEQGRYKEAVNLIRIVGEIDPYGNNDKEMLQILLDRLVEHNSPYEIEKAIGEGTPRFTFDQTVGQHILSAA